MGSSCWVPSLWEVKVQAPVGLLAAFPRGQRLLGASPVGGEGAGPCGRLGRFPPWAAAAGWPLGPILAGSEGNASGVLRCSCHEPGRSRRLRVAVSPWAALRAGWPLGFLRLNILAF